MKSIVGAAVVPAAPLMLPAASPAQPPEIRDEVAQLRGLAAQTLTSLPAADVAVILAAGPRGIHDQAIASLTPLGVEGADAELSVEDAAIEHLSRLTQYPLLRGDPLGIDHAVLSLQVRAVRPGQAVLPVSVPPSTDFEVLVSVGASIGEAIRDAALSGVVVCAGDLSAALHEGSPRHVVDGAKEWDDTVRTAFDAGSLKALADLGPEEASRVSARGWAPLGVLHGVCAAGHLRVEMLGYHGPRGVGEIVGRCVTAATNDREPYEVDGTSGPRNDGIVPRTGDPRG